MSQKERILSTSFSRRYGAEIIKISGQTGGNRNCQGGVFHQSGPLKVGSILLMYHLHLEPKNEQ